MSKAKSKKTEAPSPKLDTVVLCDKCPGNLRIKASTYHGNEIYLPNYTCGVCRRAFSPEATEMVADQPETNDALREREPKIVEYKLAAAEKTIEDKTQQIALLSERVASYERAMQYMGGSINMRLMRGMF